LQNITVAVDTSGSISNEQVIDFASELTGIASQYHAHCTVIYCDAEVAGVEEFEPEELPLQLHPAGGGGTDFRPPFGEVVKRGLEPKCFIYFTDGFCSSFPDEPSYPVLWVVQSDSRKFEPPFGDVAYL
jgi:predicted metal-dependent peptidase